MSQIQRKNADVLSAIAQEDRNANQKLCHVYILALIHFLLTKRIRSICCISKYLIKM